MIKPEQMVLKWRYLVILKGIWGKCASVFSAATNTMPKINFKEKKVV